jgi:hypothetical protein
MAQGWSDWKQTTAALKWTRGCLAMPECCYCRRPARETEVKFWEIEPGTPTTEIPYYLPGPRFRCKPGKGCNSKPRSRIGVKLRSYIWDGPPPFYRVRDGAYLWHGAYLWPME